MTKDQFKALPKEQRYGAFRKFQQSRDGSPNFADFVTRIKPEFYGDAIMFGWCGMYVGVEVDGYTHT